jgi:hypothetical protein
MSGISPIRQLIIDATGLIPPIADIIYSYAEDEKSRVSRIQTEIDQLNTDLQVPPQFAIRPGTLTNATEERGKIGVDLPAEMGKSGLTVVCTRTAETTAMIRFFNYLATDQEITSFQIVNNESLQGVDQAIADCLKANTRLLALDVHYSFLGEEGVLNIINALAGNSSLKYLNIRSNGINNHILARLLEILKNQNKALCQVSFTQNYYESEKALDAVLVTQIHEQLTLNVRDS